MKKNKKIIQLLKACVIVTIVVAMIMPGTACISEQTNTILQKPAVQSQVASTQVPVIKAEMTSSDMQTLDGDDICLSPWAFGQESGVIYDDLHPTVAKSIDGNILLTYEALDPVEGYLTVAPIIYYENSETDPNWYLFAYIDSTFGSGEDVTYPKVCYDSFDDEFYLAMVDPYVDESEGAYPEIRIWFPGDLFQIGEQFTIWFYGGGESYDYQETAVAPLEGWFLSPTMSHYVYSDIGFDAEGCPSMVYLEWDWDTVDPSSDPPRRPEDIDSTWAFGGYFDGQSIMQTAPGENPAIAVGENKFFIVMQHNNETTMEPEIALKRSVTDLDPESDTFLYTQGGGPDGMDKYADIEAMPWQEYLMDNASDPDVAAMGSSVVVVYQKEGDVLCSYSADDGDTFAESVVAEDAGFPAVYSEGNTVYCVYVKSDNLELVTSEDAGATWSDPTQINDVDGTVEAIEGTADIDAGGIVWTDNRNVADHGLDVYYNPFLSLAPDIPDIEGPSQIKVDEEAEFTATTEDPQGDDVAYKFEWGNGEESDWTEFVGSGESKTVPNAWDTKGDYEVRVKAKDDQGHESGWSAPHPITVPRNRGLIFNGWFLQILEQYFPVLYNLVSLLG